MQHFCCQDIRRAFLREEKINSERFTDMEGDEEMEDELCIMHEQRDRWKERDGIDNKADSGRNERSLEA